MQQVFVWTLGDVVGVSVVVVMVVVFGLVAMKQWIASARCKHDGGVNETMACDAICRKCGKNLGFIGQWREKQHSA